ncbi:trimethylamine methyltransferase [Desulfosarcina alkanivorans]|uniref:Methyltransferase n=1 Tax=Desulfosarcina alkanivorans TaxID=571177 RepID=A0A5K7YCD8_9BACT|nr:trimethylamine methyltransferase family protein [Desulfosarcina alkanivorans]BBO66263.1 trimethylamine methyltransferase [Desulfosarcina alkanivorans]
MNDRMQVFTRDEVNLIHDASMEILAETGVKFNSEEALDLFRQNGFKVTNPRVYFTEKEVMRALETVPSRFIVHARNPKYNVAIGEDDFVFLPTAGAPNVSNADGIRRPAVMADYHTSCKLVQTSDQLDMNGFLTVQPNDVPSQIVHLDMMLANLTLCDKAFLAGSNFRQAAADSVAMAAIAWGGVEKLRKQPVMAAVVHAASPLKYSPEMAEIIIDMARLGQPLVITDMVLAGTSGPVSLPGLLAMANAEILSGIVLSQLSGPGTPVVYGSVSAPSDMRTVASAVGAPEAVTLASAVIQLARHYRIPCRTGGMLTNSHCMDSQAAAEGTLMMSTAVRNGANFILHACGQLGSYISMSFEKWILDEEVCRTLRRVLTAMDVNVESIDVATIKSLGSDGNYLTHPTTFKHCRSLYQPRLFTRDDYQAWERKGARCVADHTERMLADRLATYEKPPIDEGLEAALADYTRRQKKRLMDKKFIF